MCPADIPACIISCMHIIPVIDLKDGLVVAARQGKRHTYRPLATPFCTEPDILSVSRAYLSIFPFRTLYIADLNAIENNGNNHTHITRLLETHSDLDLWIDTGLDPYTHENTGPYQDRINTVLGSETGITPAQLANYTRKPDCILSLDYTGNHFLGNENLLGEPTLLPQRIIIMSLQHVGSDAGPDLKRISSLANKLQGKQIYAAGGIRNADDLRLLATHGIHGALLASSLHNRKITPSHLEQLRANKDT